MKLALIDWPFLILIYAIVVGAAVYAKRYMRGVADFLAAGRTAGRYLMSVASGAAGLGSITIVANLQMNYEAGFAMSWWGMSMALFVLVVGVTGWVNYRFRATRCLTLAEFFERRYSKRFRMFAGLIAYVAGIVNFGIFPAVAGWFFMYYLGLPERFTVLGLSLPTFPTVMFVLLVTAVYSVFSGGQIAVIVSDFLQGLFTNIVFVVVMLYLLHAVGWGDITATLLDQPPGKSLVNPFDTSYIPDFNFWYFLIGVFGMFYGAMSWQGGQAYNTSAKSAHEGKMGNVLSNWRQMPQGIFMTLVPVIMMTVYRNPHWEALRSEADAIVGAIANPAVASQMRVPVILSLLLPAGLFGAFAAVMLACTITTHNTYMHSWGSILIQDVLLPFRKRQLAPEQHVNLLRWSILFVALFIFVFSLLYKQTDAILMFFAITGAIFAGGSGAVIIGGLYTSWGTTLGAWVAMITGSTIAVGGIILQNVWAKSAWLLSIAPTCPINGQEFWGIAMGASAVLYIIFSLVKPQRFSLPALFNRGQADVDAAGLAKKKEPPLWQRVFAITKEFTLADKVIYVLSYAWTFGWIIVFIAGSGYNVMHHLRTGQWTSSAGWINFWQSYVWIYVAISVVVMIWFAIGGLRDLGAMFRQLNSMERDTHDTGQVEER